MPSTPSIEGAAAAPPGPTAERARLALVVLAFGGGATDAFAFLCLGGIFTANMTGNLILVALFGRAHYLGTLVGATTAIVVFAGTLYLAFKSTGAEDARLEREQINRSFLAAILVQAAVLAGWLLLPHRASLAVATILVVFSAAAMAMQTVITKRIAVRSGVSTTFVTGTISSLMEELAEGKNGERVIRLLMPLCLVGGALTAAAIIAVAPDAGPVLPLAAIVAAFALKG